LSACLDPLRHSWPDFHALHNCATFDGFSINYVAYGGSVSIDPGCSIASSCCRCRSVAGRRCGREAAKWTLGGCDGVAAFADTADRMIWQDDCAHLILLVDRQRVESRAAALAERPAGPVSSSPCRPHHAFWPRLQFQIEYLVDLASTADRLPICRRHRPRPCANPSSGCLSPVSVIISAMPSTGRRRRATRCPRCSGGMREPGGACRRSARSGRTGATVRHRHPIIAAGLQAHFGVSISGVLQHIRLQQLHARLRKRVR